MGGILRKEVKVNNKRNHIIEFAPFTLAEGVDESTLMAASDALQTEFLNQQKGFIKRDLVRIADSKWADVLYWETRESVEKALQEAPNNQAALNYFQLMANVDQEDPNTVMMLLSIVKSYS
jgi:hypothetical protein